MAPHREDFARWLDDPVTRWVLRALEAGAEKQRAAWSQASWDNGHANPALLQELRVRADAYRAVAESNYEGFCDMLGDEPRDE